MLAVARPALVLFVALTLFAAPARAQDPTPSPAPPPPDSSAAPQDVAPSAAPAATAPAPAGAASAMPALAAPLADDADSALALPVLVEPRPRADIDNEIALMTQLNEQSLARLAEFKQRLATKVSQIDVKKAEVSDAKRQADLAKKEKRAEDQKKFEASKKQLELQQRFLERMRDLFAARGETEQATATYARSRIDACKAEIQLNGLGPLTSAAVRKSAATRMALNKVNDTLKLRAEAMGAAADKERAQVLKRQAVVDAYADMFR